MRADAGTLALADACTRVLLYERTRVRQAMRQLVELEAHLERDRMTATVTSIVMQKGGVGKTTTTICAARAASVYHSARVLVIDLDPQGNTTSTLAADEVEPDQLGIADAILPSPDATLGEVVVPTVWRGVNLAPGGATLQAAERHIEASQHGREHRLRKALDPVRGSYDLILIDNAPALGTLLVNSLTAADLALLVVEAEQWSADGLALLRTTLDGVVEFSNPRLRTIGTVVNKWRHTASARELAAEISDGMATHFPGVPVWTDRRIPLWQGIPDHVHAGRGLDEGPTKLRALAEDTFRPIAGDLLASGRPT